MAIERELESVWVDGEVLGPPSYVEAVSERSEQSVQSVQSELGGSEGIEEEEHNGSVRSEMSKEGSEGSEITTSLPEVSSTDTAHAQAHDDSISAASSSWHPALRPL